MIIVVFLVRMFMLCLFNVFRQSVFSAVVLFYVFLISMSCVDVFSCCLPLLSVCPLVFISLSCIIVVSCPYPAVCPCFLLLVFLVLRMCLT